MWEDLVLRQAPPSSAPVVAAPAPVPAAQRPRQRRLQAAYLAHELRAPVTSIRLGLEGLADGAAERLTGEERKMLDIALRNTVRLEGLVNDIMDYAKTAAGRLELERRPCEARVLVDEAVDAMRAAALARGVRLAKDVEPGLPALSAEGRRVVQVLINLLSNAIKHSPERAAVTVSARLGERKHAGTIVFRVKDAGPGLAPEDLERVFGLFEQAGGSVKKSEGTGLGLTLSRALVELHGGRIWAESWKGCGATFCFTIPLASSVSGQTVAAYAEPLQVHGLLADAARRFNAVLALFV